MITVLGVIGFILVVAIVHWLRTTATDLAARGINGLVAKATPTRPTVWGIVPDTVTPEVLLAAIQNTKSASDFGRTSFSISTRAGERVVRCSTPPEAALATSRGAILQVARHLDPGCRLQL